MSSGITNSDGDPIGLFREEVMAGIFPSIANRIGPLWIDGQNVVFDNAAVKPMAGQLVLFSKQQTGSVTGLLETYIGGEPVLYTAYEDAIYDWDAGNGSSQQGSGYTGDVTNLWSFARVGEWVLATNGVDTPAVDKARAGFGNLSGPNFSTAEIFLSLGSFAVALNTSNGDRFAEWSDEGDVEEWTDATNNFAGSTEFLGLESEIRAGLAYGELRALVFGSNSIHQLAYTGPGTVFGAQKVLEGVGAVGKASVVSVGSSIYGFSSKGPWVSNLVSFRYIAPPAINTFIFNDINRSRLSQIVTWYNRAERQIVFFYPSSGSLVPNRGVGLSVDNGAWTIYGFGRLAVSDAGVFDYAVTADNQGNVFYQNVETASLGGVGEPVTVLGSADFSLGYGEGGYGELGYGGSTVDVEA